MRRGFDLWTGKRIPLQRQRPLKKLALLLSEHFTTHQSSNRAYFLGNSNRSQNVSLDFSAHAAVHISETVATLA